MKKSDLIHSVTDLKFIQAKSLLEYYFPNNLLVACASPIFYTNLQLIHVTVLK